MNGNIENEIVDIHGDLSLVLRGEDGLSAYEVAVKNGFVGTEQQWLDSLKGEASKAEAATAEALVWRNSAKDYAVEAGNHEEAAKGYRNECQTIKDSIAPQVTQAISAIQEEKAEAEAKKALVDEAAAQAHLDRVQADADAAEVRYLHGETVEQKNIATDAAERARRYAAREFNWEDLNERPTTRDGFPITDVPKVDGTDATGTWDIDITGDAATVNGHTVAKNVPANAVFTDTTYHRLTAEEAAEGTATTARAITAKVLADYVADVVATAVASLVNSSPATLDTLKELADALGEDPNFATTMATALADKLGKTETAANAAKVNNLTVETAVPANAVFTDTTYSDATTSTAGLMSAEDKAKLNGIAEGAQVNTLTGVKGNAESSYRTGDVNITKANIGLGDVDNTSDSEKRVAYATNAGTVNGFTVGKAVPANAKFTDTTYDAMTSSELSDGTSTQGKLIDAHTLATFILTVAADVVNNAPEALDTLAELAQALGDDPNFATTVMNEIGKKLDKSGGVITGNLTVNGTLTGNIVGSASKVNNHTVESDVPANAKFTDTTYSNFVKSGTGAKAGLVPAPSTTAGTTKYLREDGTWTVPPDNNTTYTAASATPKANGTAAVGTSAKYAREDHVHPLQTSVSGSSGSCTGNAATASKISSTPEGGNWVTGATAGKALVSSTVTAGFGAVWNMPVKEYRVACGASNSDNVVRWYSVTKDNVSAGTNTKTKDMTWNAENGTLKTDTFSGALDGNAATATKLKTARTINIQDSSATNTGTGASFDGSGNATIKLPATIKADVTGNVTGNVSGSSGSCTGNAATATKATGDKNGNDIAATYLPLAGGTMTGDLLVMKDMPRILVRNNNYQRGTAPEAKYNNPFFYVKQYGNANFALFEHIYDTDMSNTIGLRVYRGNETGHSHSTRLAIGYDGNGNPYTEAPTPADNDDNSTKIATTAWIRTATGNTNLNAATATRATYDENGVRISTSYAPQAQIDYLADVATNSVSAAVSAKNDAETAKNQAQNIADGLVAIRDTAVDTSLAISGQAADSKTVGDKFNVIGASEVTNDEYAWVLLDSQQRVLLGVKADGSVAWQKGIPKPINDELNDIKARLSALEG